MHAIAAMILVASPTATRYHTSIEKDGVTTSVAIVYDPDAEWTFDFDDLSMIEDTSLVRLYENSSDIINRGRGRASFQVLANEVVVGTPGVQVDISAYLLGEHRLGTSIVIEPFSLANPDGRIDFGHKSYDLILTETLPGDADNNGAVEFPDFVTLANNFGMISDAHPLLYWAKPTWEQADFDFNNRVDFGDFALLADNFGLDTRSTTAAVPEPSGLLLFSLGPVWLRRLI